MAVHLRGSLNYSSLLMYPLFWLVFVKFCAALPLLIPLKYEVAHKRSSGAQRLEKLATASPPPQVRLHPGLVVSVVIVVLAAIIAAVFIIRKYCFPQSDITYRYSVLRQMEESANVREDESDEDLLE